MAADLQEPGGTAPLPARTPPQPPPAATPLPGGATPQPSRAAAPLPARTPSQPPPAATPLPARTSRYRRSGRHSSPHQLSLPSGAPHLIIAVPGAASPESGATAAAVASLAASSCRGAAVQVGYLEGGRDTLTGVLAALEGGPEVTPAVIVPLVAFSDPGTKAAVAAAIAATGARCLAGLPLGPHPLLAEAVHARLAEAGLARVTRAGRISIASAAEGIIVGAVGGPEAVAEAGVVAVLLASRLTIPAVAASLTDPASVRTAAEQLRAARVTRVVLAPCVIGPELPPGTLARVTAETGLACAALVGGHPAVGQLVAIRYGAALADPELASLLG
jgi:sirohydrochlorin ferrochelatase